MSKVIILFGPPGAGKGTQSELLTEKFGLFSLESSKVIEREFKNYEKLSPDSPERFVECFGEKIDVLQEMDNWKKGILTSPPFATMLITREIKRVHDEGESLMMSGSPRTMFEVEREMPLLVELYGKENINIGFLEISPETTAHRNSKRKICELMRHSILHNKETEKLTLCPLDGSKLVKREGLDDPETIKTRLVQYKERTLPMLEYFKNNDFVVHTINGEQSPAEVHQEILNAFNELN
jgi:adenylate kinase